jgi:Domain of unknown function (DUF4198)/Carboxypeptidase regulatory-like domain
MNRFSKTCLVIVVLLLAPRLSIACESTSFCTARTELNRTFTVRVTADDKPVSGVLVEVETNYSKPGKENKIRFTGTTGADGSVRIPKLRAGRYTLSAEYLGLSIDYDECLDVLSHPTDKAEKEIHYTWGDEAAAVTGQVRGKLMNGERDPKLPIVERITHLKAVPIAGASLSLRSPSTKVPYTTTTGDDGSFVFSGVPDGTYVLHLDAGKSISGFTHEHDDQLIRVSNSAKPDDLEWELGAAICGSAIFYFPARHGL